MTRCLRERALLRVYLREGTAAEHVHLRRCADCAEHYERLVEDLETIGQVLDAPPVSEIRRVSLRWERWTPAAVACAVLVVLVLDVAWLRRPSPVQVTARTTSVSAFASDLSDALFATADANALPQMAVEALFVEAALEAGQPCTEDRFFTGECNDQLSAFLIQDE